MVTTRRSIAGGVTFVVEPAPSLSIAAGNTVTTTSGTFDTYRGVENAGTYSNAGSVDSALIDVNDASTWDATGTVETSGTTEAAVSDTTSADIDTTTSTLTRSRSLVGTANDIDVSSTVLDRVRALVANATDVDISQIQLLRERFLTTIDSGSARSIASGDTFTVQSGDTDESLTVSNSGTLSNAGTYESRDKIETADIDASSTVLDRERSLSASSADIDTSQIQLTRLRELVSTAADVDASDTQLTRERSLIGSASDVDSATAPLFVIGFIEADRAVATVEEILDTPNGHWSNTEPDVQSYWDTAQSERGPGDDQPAQIYVWSPTGESIDRFSLDNSHTRDTATVECLIYSLDERDVLDYMDEARLVLEEYFDDNKKFTGWQTVEVTEQTDYREQKPHRQTDHYVVGLQIELEKISSAGLA